MNSMSLSGPLNIWEDDGGSGSAEWSQLQTPRTRGQGHSASHQLPGRPGSRGPAHLQTGKRGGGGELGWMHFHAVSGLTLATPPPLPPSPPPLYPPSP